MKRITSLVELLAFAKEVGPKKIAVALAEDPDVMEAVENARKEGVADAFLVGDADKLKKVTDPMGIDLSNYQVVDVKGGQGEIGIEAVKPVSYTHLDVYKRQILKAGSQMKKTLS